MKKIKGFFFTLINLLAGLVAKSAYSFISPNSNVIAIIFVCFFGLLGLVVMFGSYAEVFSYFESSEKTKKRANLFAICFGAIPAVLFWILGFFLNGIDIYTCIYISIVVVILVVAYETRGLGVAVASGIICILIGVLLFNSTNTSKKVECGVCHGSGTQPDYAFDCLFCDGKGYVTVESKGDAKNICSSCKETVDKLITKEDASGDTVTWCSKCWDNYYDIMY